MASIVGISAIRPERVITAGETSRPSAAPSSTDTEETKVAISSPTAPNAVAGSERLKRWGMLQFATAGLGISAAFAAGAGSMFIVGRSAGRNQERKQFCENPVQHNENVCHTYSKALRAPTVSSGVAYPGETNADPTQVCGSGTYSAAPDLAPHIDAAVSYLQRSPEAKAFLDTVGKVLGPIEVRYDGKGGARDSNVETRGDHKVIITPQVTWDPYGKLVFRENSAKDTPTHYENGCSAVSAASILLHETGHAYNSVENPFGKDLRRLMYHPMYDNFEERDAILQTNRMMQVLAEPPRQDHSGTAVRATSLYDFSSSEACSSILHSDVSRLKSELVDDAKNIVAQIAITGRNRYTMMGKLSSASSPLDDQTLDTIDGLFIRHREVLKDFDNYVKQGGSPLDFDVRYLDHIADIAATVASLKGVVKSVQYL